MYACGPEGTKPGGGRELTALLLAATLAFGAAPGVQAQQGGEREDARQVMLMAGLGNGFGGVGMQAELYVAEERLAVFGGFGYAPSDRHDLGGPAGALGVRGYTAGDHHRGFLDVALTPLMLEDIRVVDRSRGVILQEGGTKYGPGVTAGYQLTTGFGLTAMLSGGLGVAFGLDDVIDEGPLAPMLNLGVGYTFR